MNLTNLFEGAVDELERRRIEDLELKMDDLARRAKESKDPKVVAALRHEFAKAKAERDSYHYVQEWEDTAPGHDRNQTSLEPVEEADYQPVTKPVPQPRKLNPGWALDPTTKAELKRRKDVRNRKGVDEAEGRLRVSPHDQGSHAAIKGQPYSSNPHPVGSKEHLEWSKGHNSMRARRAQDMDEAGMDWAAHKPTGPKFGGYLKGTDPAPTEFGNKGVGGCEESAEPKGYAARVNALIRKGLTRSDAQGVADAEVKQGKLKESENPMGQKELDYLIAKAKQGHTQPDPELHQGDEHEINGDQDKIDEAQPQAAVPRNFVVKNMKQSGQGKHKDMKRAQKQGDVKHKGQAIPTDEGAKVDRMAKHIEKSEKALGHSKDDAESIAWATLNKRGYLDNANKKKHNESVNFMEWAVAQGNRFPNFTANPATYAQAKEAYLAEGFGTALANVSSKISGHPRKMKSAQQIRNKAMKFKPQPIAEDDIEEDCWKGYKQVGMKDKGGKQVPNCVPVKENELDEDWQKANKKDKTDGMSKKAVKSYRREHPGSKLKTAVTKKPSELKAGSKDAKRRKSFCARMSGNKGPMKDKHGKPTPKAKALRRWHCEGVENLDAMLAETIEKGGDLQPGQYYIWTVYFDDGSKKRIKVTKDNFDPKAYYAKKNQVVINTDYDWTVHNG